jgi:thiol:disulfide interchange protein DsbC
MPPILSIASARPARSNQFHARFLAALFSLACMALGAQAQEATIRKNLSERLPSLPKIDEISKSPMPGLYEVRVNGADIFYTDEQGNFLVQGSLIDTKQKRNLTEERVEKLSAIDFASLPLADAFAIVRGKGQRKVAVFEDPNCGYCKRFEADLAKIDNITVYVFLYPILSPDSTEKSRRIWCAKDRTKAWTDWMLNNKTPAAVTDNAKASSMFSCDSKALERNVAFGKKYRITGTPTLIFANGTRVPGAIEAAQIEQLLVAAASPVAR